MTNDEPAHSSFIFYNNFFDEKYNAKIAYCLRFQFEIFDRWGELIYSAANFPVNDTSVGWNGFFRTETMPSGLYPWLLRVQFKDGSVGHFKGAVTLIR
jgi:gliding motility-associated-like protein